MTSQQVCLKLGKELLVWQQCGARKSISEKRQLLWKCLESLKCRRTSANGHLFIARLGAKMWSIGVFAIFFLKTCACKYAFFGGNSRPQNPLSAANAPQCTQTRFFHNPDDCSKYFLCLDGEIFEFQCSEGLLFDENRQTCDQRSNCAGATAACRNATERACADGTCLPAEYFCDGSDDCLDGSDEKCGEDDHAAGECDEDSCKLPSCFCSKTGKEIPGNLNPDKIPQMILLTFEDGVSYDTRNILTKEIFAENRRNPNGCGLRATFFISHHKNDYQQTQKLWNDGHEIAVHSVT